MRLVFENAVFHRIAIYICSASKFTEGSLHIPSHPESAIGPNIVGHNKNVKVKLLRWHGNNILRSIFANTVFKVKVLRWLESAISI